MSCLSGKFSNHIYLNIGVRAPLIDSEKIVIDPHGVVNYMALLDTGASYSCITNKIVNNLKLQPIGMKQFSTPNGNHVTKTYFVDLLFPFETHGYIMSEIEVSEFVGPEEFDVLIGMDIISKGHLSISHDGHYSFCL